MAAPRSRPRAPDRGRPLAPVSAVARWAVVTLALTTVPSGCAGTQADPVADTAGAFYAALADEDGATACDVLAPRTRSEVEQSAQKPCEEAILEEDVPDVTDDRDGGEPREVSTFGTSAQVRYDGETTFLSRYDDGWRVVAAGCTPGPAGVYDCQVEAG